jgi:hypothetical protein
MKDLFVKFFDLNGIFGVGRVFCENGITRSAPVFSKLESIDADVVVKCMEEVPHVMGGFKCYIIGYDLSKINLEPLMVKRKSEAYGELWHGMSDQTLKMNHLNAYKTLNLGLSVFLLNDKDHDDVRLPVSEA